MRHYMSKTMRLISTGGPCIVRKIKMGPSNYSNMQLMHFPYYCRALTIVVFQPIYYLYLKPNCSIAMIISCEYALYRGSSIIRLTKQVQKRFPNNRNIDNFGTTIPSIEILIIEELLLQMEYFINPGIMNSRS